MPPHPGPRRRGPSPPEPAGRGAGRRDDVLAELRGAHRPLSIAELAERVGVHPNTVRFHLDVLEQAGQVERVVDDRRGRGRPAQLFAAVAGMDPAGPRRFGELAAALAAALDGVPDGEERARQAGHRWGRQAASRTTADAAADPVDLLVGLLGELDFDPVRLVPDGVPGRSAHAIGLRRCPFLEVAVGHRSLVCPVHLGLMQGALAGWRAPVTVDTLVPFEQPDLCRAQLATRPA